MSYLDEVRNVGRGFGCAAMIAVVMVPLFPLLFAVGWTGAHCEPVPDCRRDNEVFFGLAFGGILVAAIMVGAGVAKFLNMLAARRDDQGESTGFLLLSTAITVGVTGLVLLVGYALLS